MTGIRPSAKIKATTEAEECDCDVTLKAGYVRDDDTKIREFYERDN
jgi:hypothetical protein